MAETIKIGIADIAVSKAPNVITTLGLGSCIGIAMYDPQTKIGGLVHVMLPDSTKIRAGAASNPSKFADTGIQKLYDMMIKAGANKARMTARIAGGAKMFEVSGTSDVGNVGDRNAEASRAKLKALGVRLTAEDCGENYGRTVELHCDDGSYLIKAVGRPVKKI